MHPQSSTAESLDRTVQRYPLGVLFVHGIGDQPRGDTLGHFADPIVRSLNLWIKGVAEKRGQSITGEEADQWARSMPSWVNRREESMAIRVEAWQLVVSGKENIRPMTQRDKEALSETALWSGAAVLRDGWLPPPTATAEAPPHGVLDIHTLDRDYTLNQKEVLLAESWWAQNFVPPSASALIVWAFKTLPLVMGMHFGDKIRLHCDRSRNTSICWWQRLIELLFVVFAFAMMVGLLPLFTIFTQITLTVTLLFSVVPIPALQRIIGALHRGLTLTIGDSFLMAASPVSRASMVGQFKRDFEWLCERCDQVMVVAHSQGCAVSFLGLCETIFNKLESVTWLGSGLRKLEVLRTAEFREDLITAGWAIVACPIVLLVWRPWLPEYWVDWTWETIVGVFFFSIILLERFLWGYWNIVFNMVPRDAFRWVEFLGYFRVKFFDIFASHDPVPHGALFNSKLSEDLKIKVQVVSNRRSLLSDHTTYWTNLEEVVLPLAHRIARLAGIPVDHIYGGDEAWLKAGQRRRVYRVLVLAILRWIYFACVGIAIFAAPQPWHDMIVTIWQSVLSWFGMSSQAGNWFDTARSIAPKTFTMVMGFWGLLITWRAWDLYEQRRLLAREQPGNWPLLGLAWVVLSMITIPISIWLSEEQGEVAYDWWRVGLLFNFMIGYVFCWTFDSSPRFKVG